jgi:hypothetical protein
MRFYFTKYVIYQAPHEDEQKGGTAIAIKKGIPHTRIDLPPFLSEEATGVCIPIGNIDICRIAVYKSLQRLWSDTDITELLGLRNKSILEGDLNKVHPVWNSKSFKPLTLEVLGIMC